MKTAVEWLVDELYKQGISLYTPELIAEAKEMEKEQNEKYNELKEVIEDMIKHLDEGIHLTLRKDSIIVEALRNTINKK